MPHMWLDEERAAAKSNSKAVLLLIVALEVLALLAIILGGILGEGIR